ncbi:Aste57867_12397 [Aphanomyces stellatus]|uniref:Aste57867_12397 protein n=1 Tax=Aphanomyces stellatus TaxID=120398 RepID=A0A485KVX2_9STRA|nr:hypothetical protein As57867_012351 [Aphanomyces stellatus]VFT89248.1 Aste57867_12397 [Aphanomyces stellatus]
MPRSSAVYNHSSLPSRVGRSDHRRQLNYDKVTVLQDVAIPEFNEDMSAVAALIHPADLSSSSSLASQPTTSKAKTKHLATHGTLHTHGFAFLGDNHYIRSGYRLHYSATDCLRSLFEWHNETWNVWIHVVGSLAFATLLAIEMFAADALPEDIPVDRWPLWLFLGSVSLCFALSSLYHLMYVQDAATASLYLRFDFAGILVLIFGAAVPLLHYTFFCSPALRTLYVGLSSVVGLLAFVATFQPAFSECRFVRLGVFGATILTLCIVPLTHVLIETGPTSPQFTAMLQPLVVCLVFNVPGVLFYAARVPERWSPGSFDVVGSSHQWWHLCVALAAVTYFSQVQVQYAWRRTTGCPVDAP